MRIVFGLHQSCTGLVGLRFLAQKQHLLCVRCTKPMLRVMTHMTDVSQ